MKKSTWFALITIILIVLILQSFGGRVKFYEKKKEYKSQEEVIEDYLKNVNLLWGNRGRNGEILNIIPNLDLYETISDRYRLLMEKRGSNSYISIPYFKEYTIENVTEIDEIRLEEVLNTYKSIKGYKIPKTIEIYKVEGQGSRNIQGYTSEDINSNGEFISSSFKYLNDIYEDMYIFLVIVDEGSGYVVDDYKLHNQY